MSTTDLISSSGGAEKKHARHLLTYRNSTLLSVLAQESVTPYIAMLNGEPIGYAQSYVALEAGTDGGKKKPIQEYAE